MPLRLPYEAERSVAGADAALGQGQRQACASVCSCARAGGAAPALTHTLIAPAH